MKTYSQANLLSIEMSLSKSNFFDRLILKIDRTVNPILEITLPDRVIHRLLILCKDIRELSDLHSFELNDLLQMLVADLTHFIKVNQDPKLIRERLRNVLNSSLTVSGQSNAKEVYIPKFQYEEYEDMTLRYKFKREDVLRLEVELADLSYLYPDHELSVEKIIEAQASSFHELLITGHNQEAIKSIRNFLENDGEIW